MSQVFTTIDLLYRHKEVEMNISEKFRKQTESFLRKFLAEKFPKEVRPNDGSEPLTFTEDGRLVFEKDAVIIDTEGYEVKS
jgi:hypothetical protein